MLHFASVNWLTGTGFLTNFLLYTTSSLRYTADKLDYGYKQILLRVWNIWWGNNEPNYANAVLPPREDFLRNSFPTKGEATSLPGALLACQLAQVDGRQSEQVLLLSAKRTGQQSGHTAQVRPTAKKSNFFS